MQALCYRSNSYDTRDWPYAKNDLTEAVADAGDAAKRLPLNEMPGTHSKCAQWVAELYVDRTWGGNATVRPTLMRVSGDYAEISRWAAAKLGDVVVQEYAPRAEAGYVSAQEWSNICDLAASGSADLMEINKAVFGCLGVFAAIRWVPIARQAAG